jgi:hypothetical protein
LLAEVPELFVYLTREENMEELEENYDSGHDARYGPEQHHDEHEEKA